MTMFKKCLKNEVTQEYKVEIDVFFVVVVVFVIIRMLDAVQI